MLKKIKDFLFGKPVPAFGPVAVEPPVPPAPDAVAEPAWPFPARKPDEGVTQQEVEVAEVVATALPAVKKARKPRRRKVVAQT